MEGYPYALYETATGKIVSTFVVSLPLDPALPSPYPDLSLLACTTHTAETHYVRDGEFVPRQPVDIAVSKSSISADGVDAAVLSNLPSPCTLTVNGQSVEYSDASLRLVSDHPATFDITISSWPNLDFFVSIEAV